MDDLPQAPRRALPIVRRSDGFIVPWDRKAIVRQLLTETKLAKDFFDVKPMTVEEAEGIALEAERRVLDLSLSFISGPLIRELVNNILLNRSKEKPEYAIYRNVLTRVGAPVYDAYLMDVGRGYLAYENANLQPNPETAHKRKGDWVSGEEYLLLMPSKLADAHLSGDLHIHDLEYFGVRPFCIDSKVIVPLVVDGWLTIRSIGDVIDSLFKQYSSLIVQKADYEVLNVTSLNIYALGQDKLVKVNKVMRRLAKGRALEIATRRGRRIILTRDHRVPIDGGLIRAGDLIVGHRLIVGPVAKVTGHKTELCILDELLAKCPESNLETAYVHGIRRVLNFIDEKRQRQLEEFLEGHEARKTLSYVDEVISIREVEPSGNYYYDIEVESNDHCFYAGNEGLILIHNCQDWDLRYFFYYGLMPDGMGTRTSVAGPAKHPEVAILHTAKILASAQTNFSGGEGFYNFLVFLAPYMRGLNFKEIKQLMQMMFFEYTQAYVARGGQLVFSNVQVQPGVPELWKDKPIVARGQVGPDVYGDYEDEVRAMFKALYEVAYKGDNWGKPFNFPKLENAIASEFLKPDYDELWLEVHKVVAKFGTPYFDNMMPEYRGYGKGVSCYQCCAYCFVETPESDSDFNDKLYFVNGKHFTMGSWQVVSLNLPRLAYKANGDDERLFEGARELMDLAVGIFKAKMRWMDLIVKHNRIPFATQRPLDPRTGQRGPPAVNFDELVFVIGVVGGNEMAQYHTGYQLHEHPEAIRILIKLILEMQRYRKELEAEHGMKIALARTPAESTAQRFAVADLLADEYRGRAVELVKGDLKRARGLLAEGEKDVPVYYSNGTHVYVGAEISLLDRITIEQKFFPLLSGGNMLHIWLGEASPDPEALYKFSKRIFTQTQVGYYAYTKDLTICNNCNRVSSLALEICPACGSMNVEWWSRVTGYYQAVSGWNKGKRREFVDRHRAIVKY